MTPSQRHYQKNREAILEKRRATYLANKEAGTPAWRARHLKYTYGITYSLYTDQLARQGGVCAICRNPPTGRVLDVDHNHTTGAVRGLLCRGCNTSLGKFKDSPELLRAAAAYLETPPWNRVT